MRLLGVSLALFCLFCAAEAAQININGAEADEAQKTHPETVIANAIDGNKATGYRKCYVGNMATNGWAKIFIEKAEVTEVHLLNRADPKWSKRMEGIEVSVCDGQKQCQLCATAPATASGQWAQLKCENALVGTYLYLTNKQDRLQVCEIYVFGNPVPKTLPVLKCSEYCTDYHRICPAVHDSKFYEQYVAQFEAGELEEFGKNLPPAPNCKTLFYKYACPHSCGVCTKCKEEYETQPSLLA